MPQAFFLTFSTYGTWLHGADKGLGSVDRQHNAYGMPFIPPDGQRESRAAAQMTGPPYVLDEPAREIVRDAIVNICVEKDWTLHALHVRSNHIHVVLTADRDPNRLLSDLKARASRDLNRAAHEVSGKDQGAAHAVSGKANQRSTHEVSGTPKSPTPSDSSRPPKRWTRHGSTRHLFDEDSVAAAIAYTLDEQGPPMAIYDPRPLTPCAAPSPTPTNQTKIPRPK